MSEFIAAVVRLADAQYRPLFFISLIFGCTTPLCVGPKSGRQNRAWMPGRGTIGHARLRKCMRGISCFCWTTASRSHRIDDSTWPTEWYDYESCALPQASPNKEVPTFAEMFCSSSRTSFSNDLLSALLFLTTTQKSCKYLLQKVAQGSLCQKKMRPLSEVGRLEATC